MENKERVGSPSERELVKPVSSEVEIPREIAGWIEKVERKDLYLAKPVMDDQGQVLVTSSQAQDPKVVLPLTKKGLVVGLKESVEDAVRWLAEWCLRIIKMYPEKVAFKLSGEKKKE